MIHLGFSYIGLIWLLMLMAPNMVWAKYKPTEYDKYVKNENKILLFFERIGEGLCSVCCLIFSELNIRTNSIWALWLLASFIFMVLYELYWIRYFRSAKTMADMYSSFAGFPVAGASLPCIAFFCLGIYGTNIFLIISSLILSVGHIGIHLMHRNEVVPKKKGRIVFKILKGILITPVVLMLLFAVGVIACRNVNWFKGYINTSKGVNEGIYVDIGGQEQYMLIRGRNVDNPVILYLHGGPGGPDSAIGDTFTNPLIDDYTIVCWDQRGCGRTYYKNMDEDPDNKTVSFERALQDTDEVVDYLCDRFGTDKVIVMGHSYGSLLGSTYVRQHPEKVSAYIAIGQFVNCVASDEIMYRDALEKAQENGDDLTTLEEAYAEYCAGDDLLDYMTLRNATAPYHVPTYTFNTILVALVSPYCGVDDVLWTMKQADLDSYYELNRPLFDTVYDADLYAEDMTYEVPAFFISGGCDYTCNFSLAERYCSDIEAPVRDCRIMEGHGHCPHYADPEGWAQIVRDMLSMC